MPLAPLVEPGPPLSRDQVLRYSRHLLLEQFGDLGQRRLRAAKVLVMGAGGLGSPILHYLAAAGVGTIAIVDDDTMAFLWETATQVDARVRLDEETRTVAKGALWLEESLPPETLLIGLLAADRSRRRNVAMTPDDVLGFALAAEEALGERAEIEWK